MEKLWKALMIVGLVLLAGLAACEQPAENAGSAPEGQAGGIAWMGFDEGMAKAKGSGKPVMVDFYTTWCKFCTMLDDTTYKDPEIISLLNTNFVSIKVDAEGTGQVNHDGKQMSMSELAKSFNVQGYPTVWFFDGKGEPIGPLPGYSPPEDFKPILTYITSGAYAKGVKYPDYLDSLKGEGSKQPDKEH